MTKRHTYIFDENIVFVQISSHFTNIYEQERIDCKFSKDLQIFKTTGQLSWHLAGATSQALPDPIPPRPTPLYPNPTSTPPHPILRYGCLHQDVVEFTGVYFKSQSFYTVLKIDLCPLAQIYIKLSTLFIVWVYIHVYLCPLVQSALF